MVTGDNVRTAISVARECGLVSHSASVYIPTFIPGTGNGQNARLDWSSVDDEKHKLDEYTLKPVVQQADGLTVEASEGEMNDYQLALTGDVFRWMLDFAELETMERVGRDYSLAASEADKGRCWSRASSSPVCHPMKKQSWSSDSNRSGTPLLSAAMGQTIVVR